MIVAYFYHFLIDNIGDNVGGSGEICDDSSGLGRLCAGPGRYNPCRHLPPSASFVHTWCPVFMWPVDVDWEPAPVRPVCWSRTVRLGPYCPVSGRTCRICIVWLRIRTVRLRNRFVRSDETGSSGLWEPDWTVRYGTGSPGDDEPDRPENGIELIRKVGDIYIGARRC